MIDSNFLWKYHTEFICYKVSRSLGIIAKIRQYIPRKYNYKLLLSRL